MPDYYGCQHKGIGFVTWFNQLVRTDYSLNPPESTFDVYAPFCLHILSGKSDKQGPSSEGSSFSRAFECCHLPQTGGQKATQRGSMARRAPRALWTGLLWRLGRHHPPSRARQGSRRGCQQPQKHWGGTAAPRASSQTTPVSAFTLEHRRRSPSATGKFKAVKQDLQRQACFPRAGVHRIVVLACLCMQSPPRLLQR